MACPPIITGDQFLSRMLTHIDCQAQVIGSYGYQALGEPGSLASTLVTGLLALFIVFFAVRLLFGPPPGARDVVFSVLKVGIVLTLAFSWPAFRTVIYDVTLKGPAEVTSVIQQASGTGDAGGLADRLQAADNSIVRLTELRTGRNNAALIDEEAPGGTFQGTALADEGAFGSARLAYLASVIGSIALLRIGAGLLLALAPVVAGLYFFNQSRGIFAGWLKGLVFTIAGSIGATIVLSVQLAILQPWLADAIRVRELGYATPSAPTELLTIMLSFALVQLAMIWLLSRVVFYRGWLTLPDFPKRAADTQTMSGLARGEQIAAPATFLQAERISTSIENSIRREERSVSERFARTPALVTSGAAEPAYRGGTEPQRLGNSFRRPMSRNSRSSQRRDNLS